MHSLYLRSASKFEPLIKRGSHQLQDTVLLSLGDSGRKTSSRILLLPKKLNTWNVLTNNGESASYCVFSCWEIPTLKITGGFPCWSRVRVRSHSLVGEEAMEAMLWNGCYAHSPSSCATGREEAENLGVELSSGRREGWGEGVFNIWVYFSLSYSALIGNKFN